MGGSAYPYTRMYRAMKGPGLINPLCEPAIETVCAHLRSLRALATVLAGGLALSLGTAAALAAPAGMQKHLKGAERITQPT